ncbi:unnamed protein product [Clonostachys solani]|uniref:Urea carboxylase n=1 Tax=Clonostachys solani TaxID=160281 RepID=A0A9N9ZM49_9HYPO|nr:unnamed protein product [Clonostachys solani]
MAQYPPLESIRSVLIANRGEIAVRCIHACKAVGVKSYAIYTESDNASLHVRLADESLSLAGDGTAGYLDINDILQLCERHSIDAVIPGYGFLSENVEFAKQVTDAGMIFIGPSSESITEMGLKHRAREVAQGAKVPVVPGTDLLASEAEALAAADTLTYPVILKATGGGGGMGLKICHSPEDINAAFSMVKNRGAQLFKNEGVLLEKYYARSRHVEVQVFGNGRDVIHFGERECSIQRRHQKVIEECPSPFVEAHPGLRETLTKCAVNFASALNYKSAGTVEFLVDDNSAKFFFLEMNTRLQVEHGITELCYGVDIVVLMLRQADLERAGKGGIPSSELLSLQKPGPNGVAIEARIYAEDPFKDFAPSPGVFQEVFWPNDDGVRIDTWIQSGQHVSLHYDPLIAKAMVYSSNRDEATRKMIDLCSRRIMLRGPTTNLDFVSAILSSEAFKLGDTLTNFLDTRFKYQPCGILVLSGGSHSLIQDFPARASLGHGIPKSGPMDSLTSRIANLLVGNPQGTEVVEITLLGPELLFVSAAVISVCGAECLVTVDGKERPMWSSFVIEEGQKLKIGSVIGSGCRVYLAVRGGFPNIPVVFGSKSTTPSLKFGGCQGRALQQGDFLQVQETSSRWAQETQEYILPVVLRPNMDVREIYVLQGPHDSDEIMTAEDRHMLYKTDWKVGHNSSRTGVRLLGPTPKWARETGGEAGSHPSNYLDYGYPSPGGLNWGGNSSIILTADSPNFGGLVCSTTVISTELWKLGQLKPGESFRMTPVTLDSAVSQFHRIETYLATISQIISKLATKAAVFDLSLPRADVGGHTSILKTVRPLPTGTFDPKVTYRQGGDRFLLIEFGEQSTNVVTIVRIKLLMEKLHALPDLDLLLTPHVGSLTVEYNPLKISQAELLNRIHEIESNLEMTLDFTIPCRELHIPLVMDHPDIQECIGRYMTMVRDKAAYLPDNLEYIRKYNGLDSRRQVFEIILETQYIIAAVGFLCGTPIFFPLHPKVLMGQKYNPTRTSTPGGTIGLGGSILSGYSLEQPGGYMLAARTLEMWDTFGTKPGFTAEKPWIFEPFDKVKFYEVGIEEYNSLARDFFAGKYQWQISQSTFDLRQVYDLFEKSKTDPDVVEFKKRQKEGMAEQDRLEGTLYDKWQADELAEDSLAATDSNEHGNENAVAISSPMAANVFRLHVKAGDKLKEGQVVAILEAMKMEVKVHAPKEADGLCVSAVLKKVGNIVNAGERLMLFTLV